MFDKHRFEVWSTAQHPLKHTLSDFGYSNPSLPGVTDVNSAINWLTKVLYPNTKPSVANPAALPLIGNSLNDYRVVLDDGDGKQAGYRWEQREGDVAPLWYKVFDFDWSTDSILAAFMDVTQDKYVYQQGKSDLDSSGNVIVGVYAGQKIAGGNVAGQNLTLLPNSGDGAGAHTGFIQMDGHTRPTVTGTYDLGTNGSRFGSLHLAVGAYVNTMTITGGSIVDSGGAIDFAANNLTTTGSLHAAAGIFSNAVQIDLGGNAMTLSAGSITSLTGAIDFGSNDLSTTGTITGASGSKFGDITISNGNITSAGGEIDFGGNDLAAIGTISATAFSGGSLVAGEIVISGNSIGNTITNHSVVIAGNGSGVVDIQSGMTTLGQVVTGIMSITGQLNVDNLRLDANVISSQNLNGNITLTPNGTGYVEPTSSIIPSADASWDLGAAAKRFQDIYLAGGISDGTTIIDQSVLQSLRDINVAATAGMTIFYDGTKWNPSIPDTEIDHTTLNNLLLGDAGHTQFVMLAGRSGGQVIQGGTLAGNNLILESTSNASKGTVQTRDNLTPAATASYSGSWSGTDLGSAAKSWNDVYTKGEFKGFRFENSTSTGLPSASGQNVGRAVWATDNNKMYVDVGGTWIIAGISKFVSDTAWDGSTFTQDFTVSSTITDARNAIWALHDNSNNFEQIFCKIEKVDAATVRVTTETVLPAGSYRLIGIE